MWQAQSDAAAAKYAPGQKAYSRINTIIFPPTVELSYFIYYTTTTNVSTSTYEHRRTACTYYCTLPRCWASGHQCVGSASNYENYFLVRSFFLKKKQANETAPVQQCSVNIFMPLRRQQQQQAGSPPAVTGSLFHVSPVFSVNATRWTNIHDEL